MNFSRPKIGAVAAAVVAIGCGSAMAAASNPVAPAQVRELDCLEGNWAGDAKMTIGDKTADVKMNWKCSRTSAEWGVLCSLKMNGVPGMASYEETDLFGFEPGTSKYHWFSVTNAGETHDHVADAKPGNTVEWTHEGMQDGKPFLEKVQMAFADGGRTMKLRGETFVDGKSTSLIDGTIRR